MLAEGQDPPALVACYLKEVARLKLISIDT